jgi:hypothetical protein
MKMVARGFTFHLLIINIHLFGTAGVNTGSAKREKGACRLESACPMALGQPSCVLEGHCLSGDGIEQRIDGDPQNRLLWIRC